MFERINTQIETLKNDKKIGAGDKAGILKVAEYLLTREDMNEKYNNEEKSLIGMWDFIKEQAKEKAENNVAVLADEEVYSIAIHYFDETNEALKNDKATKSKKNHTPVGNAQVQTKKENEQDAKIEENASNPKHDAEVQHNDDEVAMIYKDKPVTYKELREGTYLLR